MARKCMGCNTVYDDTVVYCPNCGTKTEKQEIQQMSKHQKSSNGFQNSINWKAIYQTVFMEYGLLTASVIALLWSWNWGVLLGTGISVGVLIVPFVDQSRVYKAVFISRVLAVINILLGIITWAIID